MSDKWLHIQRQETLARNVAIRAEQLRQVEERAQAARIRFEQEQAQRRQ